MGDAFEWYTGHSIHCEEWGAKHPLRGPLLGLLSRGIAPKTRESGIANVQDLPGYRTGALTL